jgi:hypothetical protein
MGKGGSREDAQKKPPGSFASPAAEESGEEPRIT